MGAVAQNFARRRTQEMKNVVLLAACVLCVSGTWASGQPVTSLPDLEGPPPEGLYSGYLNISGRHYYYVFARAQSQPDTAPFVFWTNGGPGCSSVGEGLWMEHGPFQVSNSRPGVQPNPYSWNRAANMLYLEHPVGVGFSYSEHPDDYANLDDFKEAESLFESLKAFSAEFPQFAPNEKTGLWLTGESYGGEYVTHLAHEIVFGDSKLLKNSLRGIALGNPALSCEADKSGYSATLQFQLYFHHGLMSHYQFRKWAANKCDANGLHPKCQQLLTDAETAIGSVNQQLLKRRGRRMARWQGAAGASGTESMTEANFDPDHKYQSFCIANSTLAFTDYPNSDTQATQCNPLGDPGRMATYLNRADVQAALHIRADKVLTKPWTDCAGDDITYTASSVNVLSNYLRPIFNATTPEQFRVLIFSGDEDIATCPAPITQACLGELDADVVRTAPWQPWTFNGITAGYFEQFDRYTFATVKGAGHTVPQYQPKTTFQLISRWLANASLVV